MRNLCFFFGLLLCLTLESYSQPATITTKDGKEVNTAIMSISKGGLQTTKGTFSFAKIAKVVFDSRQKAYSHIYQQLARAKVTFEFVNDPSALIAESDTIAIGNKKLQHQSSTDGIPVLLAKQEGSSKQVRFVIGQKVSYETLESKHFRKSRIVGITDSTLSFQKGNAPGITLSYSELTMLKSISPGKKFGGIMLMAAGVTGILLGFGVSLSAENSSGDPIAIAGLVGVVGGIVLVQPRKYDVQDAWILTIGAEPKEVDSQKKFGVGVGVGYALVPNVSSGVLLSAEPNYRLSNNLIIGFRIEYAALNATSTYYDIYFPGSKATTSLSLYGRYYFNKFNSNTNQIKPFAGAGIGMFFSNNPSETAIGFYPSVGFDVSHFSMSLDYNFIPTSSDFQPIPRSYLGFKVGYIIGHGK